MRTCRLAFFVAIALGTTGAAQKPTEGYVAVGDSIRLFYRVAGRGADTIIAIHGGPGVDLESIYGDFAPLTEHHVVIFYDQRGAGRSTLPRNTTLLSAATQISDLDAVRRHFKLERVVLVAHSYGPLLAATYAIAHPERVRGMIFFGPVPPRRGDFFQRFGRTLRDRMDSAQLSKQADANRRLAAGDNVRQACRDYWSAGMRPRLANPDSSLSRIRSDLCASDPAGIRYGLTKTNGVVMASYGDWDLRAALPALHMPALIVHGEQDAIPMDLVAEWTMIPRSRLLPVTGAAHFPTPSALTLCGRKWTGFSPSCGVPERSASVRSVGMRQRRSEDFGDTPLGFVDQRRTVMPHAERHERIIQLLTHASGDARLWFAIVTQLDDVSPNEGEEAGAQRLTLCVRHSHEILGQFFGTHERTHRAPHQLRHVVGRVKLRDRSAVSAHPV